MSSLVPMHPRAACLLLLACAPAFAAQLASTVRDAAGQPVAGAIVVGSTDTNERLPDGLERHWIAATDATGHFEMFAVVDPANLDARRAQVGLGPIADCKALIEKDYRKPASTS